jgi:hypothetical protein
MKTVRDACQLQQNALSIKLSDQIEQLDELINEEGDGTQFFGRTAITQGMQDLITEGIARLAGVSNQAIFHLKQAMGGGKTHLLVGFGLLARNPELRKTHCGGTVYAQSFGAAKTAAFNGRNSPTHFFWGEIANQLGRGEQFAPFWTGGPKAPDEKDWLRLFEGGDPILILLDEMPPYFHYLGAQPVGTGTVADIATRAFANLLTAAGKKSNVCVVVSDLAAAYDTGTKLIHRALEDARAELGRQERNITPVDLAANEIYDILRFRFTRIARERKSTRFRFLFKHGVNDFQQQRTGFACRQQMPVTREKATECLSFVGMEIILLLVPEGLGRQSKKLQACLIVRAFAGEVARKM